MKRRQFITAAFGSVCILSTSSLTTWNYDTEQEKWFENFIQKLKAKKQNRSFLLDQNLQETYQKLFKSWAKNGYKPLDANFYVFEANNLVLFPVVLDAPPVGLIDISALCFCKTIDGYWQPITHLTGFHFEAFHAFFQEFDGKNDSDFWAETLLPTFSKNQRSAYNGYFSAKGEVMMKVLTGETSPKVEFSLKNEKEEIWRKNYQSKHFRNKTTFA